jgi:hypothetical protein
MSKLEVDEIGSCDKHKEHNRYVAQLTNPGLYFLKKLKV